MSEIILGISAFYHDSSAALLINGDVVTAAQEERFTRIKNDAAFPKNAILFVLNEAGILPEEITEIAFYDKPFIKFERLLETYHAFAPKGLKSFVTALPVWMKEKLFFKKLLRNEFKKVGIKNARFYFPEHHVSHAASAFYLSPFNDAAILTIDGVGEWTTTAIALGEGNSLKFLKEIHFPHSLGLIYSAFTAYCGFRVNSGEYKLMGLAPYGNSDSENYKKYRAAISQYLIHVRPDGSFLLNMDYFDFATGLRMYKRSKWESIFGIAPLEKDETPRQEQADMALAIQHVVENIILKLAETTRQLTGKINIVLAGGVALNSVANGKLRKSGLFEKQWIVPAAGDAGGALGAALAVHHIVKNKPRVVQETDAMKNASLGPCFTNHQVEAVLQKYDAVYTKIDSLKPEFYSKISELLQNEKVVGWFQGRMEFGPRALGYRSILADARSTKMQKVLNLKIKKREGFRPFAPIVLKEDAQFYFDIDFETPYMLHVVPVKKEVAGKWPADFSTKTMEEKLAYPKGKLPAITHVDGSARVQTVSENRNPKLHRLLIEFKNQTGVGVLINTSFNERGEPIVCTPDDAFKSFMRTEMDVLVIEDFVLLKSEQITHSKPFENQFKPD